MSACQTCGGTGRLLLIPPGWKFDGTYEVGRCTPCDGSGECRDSYPHSAGLVAIQAQKRARVAAGEMRVREGA